MTADGVPLLEVEDLVVRYGKGKPAVNGVSFVVQQGETLGLVGETGSGKSTIARAILGLAPISAGTVKFKGKVIGSPETNRKRRIHSGIQVVFQDPSSSLDPSRSIRSSLVETLTSREAPRARQQRDALLQSSLQEVGLPASTMTRFPAELSGGQLQRAALVRASLGYPELIICDEPVTALDVSIQAQVLNLLLDMQEKRGLSYLFISHDLGVVKYMAHRIVVLYSGLIMEQGTADQVYSAPRHPYTKELVAASHGDLSGEAVGRTDSEITAGDGCPFVSRCRWATSQCRSAIPPLITEAQDKQARCLRIEEILRDTPAPGLSNEDVPAARERNQVR